MEADWSLAFGPDDPVLVVPWECPGTDAGFIDLRLAAHRIDEIAEAQANPPLRSALLRLNGPDSDLWTAKCDAWTTSPEQGDPPLDPYEMEAEPGATLCSSGCYIDLLPREAKQLASFALQQRWMHTVIDALRATPGRAARVELVLRPAEVGGTAGFGLTCFVEGCGATAAVARQRWAEALDRVLAVLTDDTMTKMGE